MGFLENLKSELTYQDITVKELAFKTQITKTSLDNYFSAHKSIPKADTAVKIAQALGVSVEYLVTGRDSARAETLPPEIREIVELLKKMESYDVKIVREMCRLLAGRAANDQIQAGRRSQKLASFFLRPAGFGLPQKLVLEKT